MVECEFYLIGFQFPLRIRFNRYMVECECELPNRYFLTQVGFNRYMVECEFVEFTNITRSRYSFNRYMVECESNSVAVTYSSLIVLIDTWWNVNLIRAYVSMRKAQF